MSNQNPDLVLRRNIFLLLGSLSLLETLYLGYADRGQLVFQTGSMTAIVVLGVGLGIALLIREFAYQKLPTDRWPWYGRPGACFYLAVLVLTSIISGYSKS